MLKKKQFEAPMVLQEVRIQLEVDLLGRSVEENLRAITLGQEFCVILFINSSCPKSTLITIPVLQKKPWLVLSLGISPPVLPRPCWMISAITSPESLLADEQMETT